MERSGKRDGGYGWVIVFALFLVEVLVDGVRFSYGLYFVEFLAEFGKPKADTAWIGGIMVGVYNLAGPAFAFIVNKTGYRVASMIGTVTAVTGLVLSSFATQLYHLYFSYGILQGFGTGLVFLSGTVAVSRYFLKKRAIALGISYCGSGVGTFALPPLVRLLFESYSWKGSLFVMAGLVLNCCVSSSLYRPLNVGENSEEEVADVKDKWEPVKNGSLVKNSNDQNSENVQNALLGNDEKPTHVVLSSLNTPISSLEAQSFSEIRKEQVLFFRKEQASSSHHSINTAVLSQSIFGSNASFHSIIEKHQHNRNSNLSLPITSFCDEKSILPGKRFKISIIENTFPKELVTNINFIIMMSATLSVGIPSFIPFSMLPDYALSAGATSSQSAWLLSAIGIGGIFGRIGGGLLCGMQCVNSLTLNSACYLVIGVTTMVAAVPTFQVLIVYSTIFGVFFGAIYVVQPIVLIEYLSEHFISEVMGIMMFTYGVSNFIGSPLAGWIYDVTGSYRTTFLMAGALFTLGGIINSLVLCTKRNKTTTEQTI